MLNDNFEELASSSNESDRALLQNFDFRSNFSASGSTDSSCRLQCQRNDSERLAIAVFGQCRSWRFMVQKFSWWRES